MARERTGFIVKRDGKIYVRVQFTDASGKRKERMRRAESMSEANKLRKRLIKELDEHGEASLDGDHITFDELAREYEKVKLFPAKIINGRKQAGVKSLQPSLSALAALRDAFGKRRIKSIKHAHVLTFKLTRLETPTIHGKQRAIASVNRELELLRAMFRFAISQGWIVRSPFEMGEPLISKADETQRERTLSHDEEQRLLAVLTGRRAHVRPIFIAALDTSCRRGELIKLRWRDVDFGSRTFTVTAETTKTATRRTVGMTQRLYDELISLWESSPKDRNELVFGIKSTIKTAFKSAREEAGIVDYRWHDGRHTAITRMVQTGQPSTLIKKVSGHTQDKTFMRYVNPSAEAIAGVADALGAFNSQNEQHEQTSEAIN